MLKSVSANLSAYENREVVSRYEAEHVLYPAEAAILERYPRQFAGRVLDIGVGAGRTTQPILDRCKSYVGLDFSNAMIEAAQRAFPRADMRVMDMRDVPREFTGQLFDAILISFNAIDYISWEDRCALITAIPGLLAPEGVFAFSSHDLSGVDTQRGFHLRADLRHSLNTLYRPRSVVRLALRAPPWMFKALRNRHRNRRLERTGDGYAYVNDAAEDYGVLTVYVAADAQAKMLHASGFSRVEKIQPWLRDEPAYFNYFTCQR